MKNFLYNEAFCGNSAKIILHKSSRKNAKTSDIITVNHLINQNTDKKISDERILQQFAGTVEKVVYEALGFNKHLEITVFANCGKNSSYKNANNQLYPTTENNYLSFKRVKFSSIEQAINFLYTVYSLIYPYNELSLRNCIYNNASIKNLIGLYYKKAA